MKIPIVSNYNFDEVVGHIKGNEIHLRENLNIDMRLHYLSLGFQIKKVDVLPNGDTIPVEMDIMCASLHPKLDLDCNKKIGWFQKVINWLNTFLRRWK